MKRSVLARHNGLVECECAWCGGPFVVAAWKIRQGEGKYCSRDCYYAWVQSPEGREVRSRNKLGNQHRLEHGRSAGKAQRVPALRRSAWLDPQKTCRWPGCERRGATLYQHHVVYRQELKRRDADVWDGRNSLALCAVHHTTHHHQITQLPLIALRDENFVFAFEVMGAAAFDYLRRRYAGGDPRHDALLVHA